MLRVGSKESEDRRERGDIHLPWRVVLGSATTGALPKNFGAVFKREDLRESVGHRVQKCSMQACTCTSPFFPYAGFQKRTVTFVVANSISTDISKIKFKKSTGIHKKRRLHTFFKVLHYFKAFSYSPYICLACMCVTVPTERNKYRYYAMPGTLFKKNSFPMDIV